MEKKILKINKQIQARQKHMLNIFEDILSLSDKKTLLKRKAGAKIKAADTSSIYLKAIAYAKSSKNFEQSEALLAFINECIKKRESDQAFRLKKKRIFSRLMLILSPKQK